jgi:hypothetical protein
MFRKKECDSCAQLKRELAQLKRKYATLDKEHEELQTAHRNGFLHCCPANRHSLIACNRC